MNSFTQDVTIAGQNSFLTYIFENIPDSVIITNAKGEIAFTNNQSQNMFGYSDAELLGNTIEMLIPHKHRGSHHIHRTKYLENPVLREMGKSDKAFQGLTKNGDILDMDIKINSISLNGNTYIISIIRDISQKKQAEREKEKIASDLSKKNKDLEQFAFILSHNIRGPLANIIGLSKRLSNNKSFDSETENKIVNFITASAEKLDLIIHDLNRILQSGVNIQDTAELLYFESIIEEIKEILNDSLEKDEVVIKTDFKEAPSIVTHKIFLFSILFNLVTNSIKYRKQNIPPEIAVKTKRENNFIIIEFSDNGIGIDLGKHQANIYKLYKRFHTHSIGHGIGLYMIKTQLEALSGSIEIDSTVNVGTTFTITLPYEKA